MDKQLPLDIMKRAAKGISYIAHPLRLRILEFLDVNGAACVSDITKAVGEEQVIVSQNLRKLRDAHLQAQGVVYLLSNSGRISSQHIYLFEKTLCLYDR